LQEARGLYPAHQPAPAPPVVFMKKTVFLCRNKYLDKSALCFYDRETKIRYDNMALMANLPVLAVYEQTSGRGDIL
jgi:hypothetical protein